MTTILVTGGAGYIGAHTCLDLFQKGFTPVVYDDLSNGHETFARWGPLETGDILDEDRLAGVMERYSPAAIVHFAGLIEVGQSIAAPLRFFRSNVAGSVSLLAAAERCGVDKLVFSSTCATYGVPQTALIEEDHPQRPINPYGRSKLMVEGMLADLDRYRNFRSVCLRYFNAAGADPEGRIGEWHEPETHAVPLAIAAALGRREGFAIFGTDYATRDGTCVRDFVHVMDLADAHSRAVRYLIEGGASTALNLGTGKGTTVAELVAEVEAVSGRSLKVEHAPRRAGDPPQLVAANAKAEKVLGWTPRYDLNAIVASAHAWHAHSNF